jgi:hypothetical protein
MAGHRSSPRPRSGSHSQGFEAIDGELQGLLATTEQDECEHQDCANSHGDSDL